MFKRNLFKRFLPIALSVAMTVQSLPVTSYAAEGTTEPETAIEQTTDEVVDDDAGDKETGGSEAADGQNEGGTEEAKSPETQTTEETKAAETQTAEENKDAGETQTEETKAAEAETEEAVEEAADNAEAALDTKIVVDESELKSNATGLTYNDIDQVISKSYSGANVFDTFVNNYIKNGNNNILSVEVDGVENTELKKNLTFKWQQKNAEGQFVDMAAGVTPFEAGNYQLVISLTATDRVCKAAETAISFEIKKTELTVDLSGVKKPEIGTKIADFVAAFKEDYALKNGSEELNKEVYVKSISVVVKDAVSGTEITDADAVFEKDKDYSYVITVELNDANYVVEDKGAIDIALQGDVVTTMKVTLLKNVEFTYGDEVKLPTVGTDYTVEVTYKDKDGKDVALENPTITTTWLDADGNELVSEDGKEIVPKDAGVYTVLLTYEDETGRYASCESKKLTVKINPVSVYVKPSLPESATQYTAEMTEADILKNVTYEILKSSDDSATSVDKKTFWGVSYSDDKKTQYYEPVFKLQVAKATLDKDENPVKDKDGNIEYGAYEDNKNKALISGDLAKYRVVFSGKKSVYTGSGAGTPIDLNKGTNSTDPNYAVDVTEPTITKNVVDISVIEAATLTIDVSAYDSDAKEKVYDGKAFYEKRADYKKAKIEGGKADDLSYNWYEGHTEQVVDADGNVKTEYVWNATPTFDFNYTDIKGEHNAISPVEAGLYKLEISYKDPTGKNAAKPVELIYTIHEQKVKAEIATGTDVEKFTTYSGVTTADFIDSIEDTMAKSVKIAVNNDLSNLGDELDWWEYDKDYKFAWFIERQDQIDNTKWVPVVLDDGDGGSEAFIENIQYRLCVGVIENIDNYQGRDTDVKEDTPYGGFYISNYINIDVKKMGETPLDIVVDQDKLGNLTKKYDGTPFAVPADAVSVVNARTGNVITDVELEYAWFDNTKGKYVDEAVNGGTYQLYVTFEGNDTYALLDYTRVGDANTKFIITKREISVQPVLVDEIKAGTASHFNNVVEDDNNGTYLWNFSGEILESESQDFVYGTWTEDDESYIGYKAVSSYDGSVKPADGSDVSPDYVLKAGVKYYAVPSYVYLNAPYNRNYAVTYVPAEFTPVRDSALISKAGYARISATSLKDYIGNEKDSEVITHRITPREGIAFTTGVRLPDVEETLEGNFFVFQIQAPTEFYKYGDRDRDDNVTNSLKPVYENSIRNAGGYPLNYNAATGTVTAAFKTEGKNEKYNFEIRWEDDYVEKFTVDFTGAVLEADLTKAVAPKSIAFNSPATKMAVGEKQQLDVKVTKNKLDDIICLKYVSDNAKVLSVSESGAVVAAAVGTATVKVIPCYLDKDGKKQEIKGAKQASVKISVVDVTAPKIKSVTALDTTAVVTYPALSDGYRRETYVLEGNVKEDAFKSAIDKLTNGNWKEAGFAIAPKYTESVDSKTKTASVTLSGLSANKQYTVYVRNVSGTRTLADGAKVEISAKGAVKSFKTTLSQVEWLEIGFDDEKYWDDENGEYAVDITEKRVPSITTGWFKEVAQNANAEADDHIEYVLPLDKKLSPNPTQYYAQPKLSYFVTSGTFGNNEPTEYYTVKIGDKYYQASSIAKVDKKGALTLSGVGYVYLWVVDSVTGKWNNVCLHVTAEATKMTVAKSAKIRVGEQVSLGKYATYYNAKNQKLNKYVPSLVITDVSGDTDAFVVNGNSITAKEAKKSITITVTDTGIKDSKGIIKITSKDIEAVKNLKISEVVDQYATVSFTYPSSTFEWNDDSDTEKSSQLYFRIQIIDGAKKIVSDKYYKIGDFDLHYSKGTYTCAKYISGLTRKSNYTVTVTAAYLDKASKPVSKSFKTTDIPAAYQFEYTRNFHPYGSDEYKTDDGGIGIDIGDYGKKNTGKWISLVNYPVLTSNNTYTLVAWPENSEAKNRISDTLTWKSTDTKVATVKANAGSYTATLKTLKKGTTKIEVSSKITKRIIARWTVIVNAVGEAQYYYGDFEPDEGDEIVGGIEYGDIELLTCDNPVKATLATGEGKIAKFVAPAYGEYDFSAKGLNMLIYKLDNDGKKTWIKGSLVSSYDDVVLQKGETLYFMVGNADSSAKVVTISASGTIFGTLTMDEYTSKGEYVVFTAPEDNYYTVVDSKTKKIVETIGGLKAGETSDAFWLNKGTYTVSKRVCAPLTVDGLKEQDVKAGETNWYVFTAPTGMDYTFAATKGSVSVYSDITDAISEFTNTVSVEKGDKVYISVKNTETADIKTDITVTSEAQISKEIDTDPAKTTTTQVAIAKADEVYYVQMTIPADGWYKIKTTATTATAQNNTGAAVLAATTPTVTVSLSDDTKGTDSKDIGTYYEAEFKKGDVVYVGVSSNTANTAATLAVNKIGVTTVTDGKNTATLSSDYSYYKFTAKSAGEYTFATTVTNRTEGTTPSATMTVYKDGEIKSATITLKTGEIVYLQVNTNATDGKSDSAEIKVSKLEAESFTTEWTKDFAKDDTSWIQFKAPADALYSFTTQTTQKVAGTGEITATKSDTLGVTGNTFTTPYTQYYKAGQGFFLKLVADEAVTYKITAVPVTPEKVTNSAVTIPKNSEKWFSFTAPATAKYSVKLTGDDLSNIAVARYDLIHNTNQGFESEKTLTAGQTIYYKITNNNDADKNVTFSISQIEAEALDTTEAGSSKKATLANGESVWYSFKAPAGGRYSFKASAAVAGTDKYANASVEYFTSMTGDSKTGVGKPDNAVFLKANETVYVKVTANTDAATTEVTTSVKAIVPVDISTSDVTKPAEKTETNIAANSVQWYSIKGEGTYTIKISDVTEGGNYEAYGVWNSSTYFQNCNTEVTLDADDVYTIAVKANTDKLGYKITVTKRDIKEVSLTTPVAGSLKTGEDLYVSFKVPEDGRYAIRLDGLQDVNASIRCTSNNIRDNSSANAYYDFVADMNDVIIFKVNVTSAESVNFSVKAEVVSPTDISASGSAEISKDAADRQISWYAYTAKEDGKYLVKTDSSANVNRYDSLDGYVIDPYASGEKILSKGKTYYYAVWCDAKPAANVNFSITKVVANELKIADNGTEGSLTVDVTKVAPNEKYYVSFTAPQDGRYIFSYATEGGYDLNGYNYYDDIDSINYSVPGFGNNYEKVLKKGQNILFATSYTGAQEKNYTIKVVWNKPVQVTDNAEITLAASEKKYVAFTATKSCKAKVTLTPVDGAVFDYTYNMSNSITEDFAYSYYVSAECIVSDKISTGATKYVGIQNRGSTPIKVKVKYEEGEAFTTVTTGDNEIDLAANSSKTVSFTVAEEGIYSFSHSNTDDVKVDIDKDTLWFNKVTDVYLNKGDTVLFTVRNESNDAVKDTLTITKTDVVTTLGLDTETTLTFDKDSHYAYIKVTGDKEGCYLFTFDSYSTVYKKSGVNRYSSVGGGNVVALTLNAGETVVYRVYNSTNTGSASASFSYLGRVEEVANKTDISYDITLNKGEVVYVDLSKLNGVYPFNVNSDNIVNVEYFSSLNATAESIGAGKNLSFMKVANNASFIRLTGTVDNTQVTLYVGDQPEMWSCGGNYVYFIEGETSSVYNFYCDRSVNYYFSQDFEYDYISSIDIMDDKGTVLMHIKADAFNTASRGLNAGKLYQIRVNRETAGSDGESRLYIYRYQRQNVNDELHDQRVYVAEYEQYRFDFTAPSDGTYKFYSTYDATDKLDTYAELYTSDGKFIASNDDEDDYNFAISKYLVAGEQVQLRTRDFGYDSGYYYVSIVKVEN